MLENETNIFRLVEYCEIKVLKAPEKEGGIPPLLATLSKVSGVSHFIIFKVGGGCSHHLK